MRWLLANSTKILYRDRSTERELYTSSRAWIYWMQASVRGEERERLLIGRTGLRGEMRYLSLQPVFEYNKMDWFRDLRCNFNYNYRRSTGNIEKVELKSGNFGDRSAWFKLFYPIVRGSKRYIIRGGMITMINRIVCRIRNNSTIHNWRFAHLHLSPEYSQTSATVNSLSPICCCCSK